MTDMKDQNPNVLLTAGQIVGLLLKFDEEQWKFAAQTPGLYPEYKRHIDILIDARRELTGGELK